jgi:hypothetical protein
VIQLGHPRTSPACSAASSIGGVVVLLEQLRESPQDNVQVHISQATLFVPLVRALIQHS